MLGSFAAQSLYGQLGALTGEGEHGFLDIIECFDAFCPISFAVLQPPSQGLLKKGRRELVVLHIWRLRVDCKGAISKVSDELAQCLLLLFGVPAVFYAQSFFIQPTDP